MTQKPARTKAQQEIIEKTEEFVKDKLSKDATGHDWWHIHRVRNNAVHIACLENADLKSPDSAAADLFVVELAALLHDIADWKFHQGDISEGPRVAAAWLASLGVDEKVIEQVKNTIATVSFKGAGVKSEVTTNEARIVQDADRLDAIGAIGIARTFAYGGFKGRPMHDPTISPENHQTFEQYKLSNGPTINHFYEKLLLLKDRLNTESAKKIAEHRHKYMEEFLQEFFAEWEGTR